jgi:multidrug efflux system membrane fusion protein
VESRDVSYRVTAVGSLEPSETVSVTARVSGVAERVAFREGDVVGAVSSAQGEANLRRAEATLREAQAALAKREKLREKDPGWVSAEELSSLVSRVDVAKAEVAQATAARDLALLNLRHAHVKTGVAGEIQKRLVQPGQYVTAGTVLASLVRVDPMYLRFQVSESEAPALEKGMAVAFTVRANPGVERRATLVHVADAADPRTRRVECLAKVDRPDASVRPGSFAEIALATGAARTAPVVPEGALRPTEKGFVVYVVKDGKAEERLVDTGLRTEDGSVEIRQGLSAGEILVTRGAHYLRPGADVEVKP